MTDAPTHKVKTTPASLPMDWQYSICLCTLQQLLINARPPSQSKAVELWLSSGLGSYHRLGHPLLLCSCFFEAAPCAIYFFKVGCHASNFVQKEPWFILYFTPVFKCVLLLASLVWSSCSRAATALFSPLCEEKLKGGGLLKKILLCS